MLIACDEILKKWSDWEVEIHLWLFKMIKPGQNIIMEPPWAMTRPLITILTRLLSRVYINITKTIIITLAEVIVWFKIPMSPKQSSPQHSAHEEEVNMSTQCLSLIRCYRDISACHHCYHHHHQQQQQQQHVVDQRQCLCPLSEWCREE